MIIYEVRIKISPRKHHSHGLFLNKEVAEAVAAVLTPTYQDMGAEVVPQTVDASASVSDYHRNQAMAQLTPEQCQALGL